MCSPSVLIALLPTPPPIVKEPPPAEPPMVKQQQAMPQPILSEQPRRFAPASPPSYVKPSAVVVHHPAPKPPPTVTAKPPPLPMAVSESPRTDARHIVRRHHKHRGGRGIVNRGFIIVVIGCSDDATACTASYVVQGLPLREARCSTDDAAPGEQVY